jgi:ribosomal-protein-alanine N-acetyltransferase
MTPDKFAALHAAAFKHSRAWSSEEFTRLLAQKSTVAFCNEYTLLIGRLIADEAEILTIATHPDYQMRGHAKSALVAFEREVQSRGGKTIFLEVADDNDSAKSLYLREGFERIATRNRYYSRPNGQFADALVMKKYLTN